VGGICSQRIPPTFALEGRLLDFAHQRGQNSSRLVLFENRYFTNPSVVDLFRVIINQPNLGFHDAASPS